jgi:hypothetical protein
MHACAARPLAALSVLTLLALAPASAQDVRYTTVSRGEFGGALGRWMKLFGGSSEVTEVTSIKGAKLRSDTEGSSTVLDLDAKAFTWMDHEMKTYATMTFAQAVDRANAMVAQMEDSVEAAKAQMEEAQAQREPQNVRYEVRFSSDRPGKKEQDRGLPGRTGLPPGGHRGHSRSASPTRPKRRPCSGRAPWCCYSARLWLSTAFPGYTAKQAQAGMWAEVARDHGGSVAGDECRPISSIPASRRGSRSSPTS